MIPTTLIQELVSRAIARANCKKSGNTDWYHKHSDVIDQIATLLPSGSGIDNGTKILDLDPVRVKLSCGFHHMTEGSYDGWTEHIIVVRPDWRGIKITISGPDRNEIKEYLHDVYYHALTSLVEWSEESKRYTFAMESKT